MAKILAIDDALAIRSALQLILQQHGHDVRIFEGGREALDFARNESVDIVITDLNMPEMSGMSLISHLRRLPHYNGTPIIVMTTETSDYKKNKAKSVGANGWLAKPFNEERILKVINKLSG